MRDKRKKFEKLIKPVFLTVLVALVLAVSAACSAGGEEISMDTEEGLTPDTSAEETESIQSGMTEPDLPEGTIYVHVCGAVEKEGVYELPEGSRVFEAVQAAGGMTADAGSEAVNQARVLTDGEQIYIPTAEEAVSAASGQAQEDSGKININTAGKEELMTLPGIGEAKAAAIISYRTEHGPFQSAEEIMNVSGIKEAGFSKIEDLITVN